MKSKNMHFLFRVESINNKGQHQKFVAEVIADCDENARREIIHTTMQKGNRVKSIVRTDSAARLPGDLPKKKYTQEKG